MIETTLLFRELNVEKEAIGVVPKLRFRVDISVRRDSESPDTYVHINRICFDVDLHSARDPSTSIKVGYLGTFDSLEPVTILQSSAHVDFCIPINSLIMQKMLDIRNSGRSIAFKINATAAGINYLKTQDTCAVTDIWQSQMIVFQNIPAADRVSPVLITGEQFQRILSQIGYSKIMRIEFPLYNDDAVINPKLKSTIDLLNHASARLEEGNNESAMIDVRKALTNHLFEKKNNQWILNSNLATELKNKSPTEIRVIYEDTLLRIFDGLHAILRITDKFLHDDFTIKVPPLRKDSEYVYFTVTFIVRHFLTRLENAVQ
jgi:hypothetical protein